MFGPTVDENNLDFLYALHEEAMRVREGQSIDDLGEMDIHIVRLEEKIYSMLKGHPLLQKRFDTSKFLSEPDY